MFGPSAAQDHKTCWKLLPWYVNDTLEQAERTGVEQHLVSCDACRQEVASLKNLRLHVRDAMPPESVPVDETASVTRVLQQVLHRIDDGERVRSWPSPSVRRMLAGQAAAILLLASMLVWPTAPDQPKIFETLSAPPTATSRAVDDFQTVRIVFDEAAREIELRRLLRSVKAEIVGGPTDIGAYTLRVERQSEVTDGEGLVLSRLRADPMVRLAEPVI